MKDFERYIELAKQEDEKGDFKKAQEYWDKALDLELKTK